MNLFYESRLKASDSTPTYIVPTKSLLCGLCKLGVCGTIPREAKYGYTEQLFEIERKLGGWILAHSLTDPFMLEVYPLWAFAAGAQCLSNIQN